MEWWTEEDGLEDLSRSETSAFLDKEENSYRFRTMLEIIDMPWNWPVEVNYHEAKAFCNWKSAQTGKRRGCD